MDKETALPIGRDDSRLRILYLFRMLQKHASAERPLSSSDILARLESEHGIHIHRTTLPKDIEVLRAAGIDVQSVRKRALHYYIPDSPLTLPELRLLTDAVLSSKFITEKKSQELVEKLYALTSDINAEKLRRAVHVTGKVKTDNEKGYAIVDAINEAIHQNRKISFYYYDYNGRKERVLRNDGKPYTVSPYDLIWDGDYYYLTGFCDERDAVRVFRVDRIRKSPQMLAQQAVPRTRGYRVEKYTQEVFRMYATQETAEVRLLCSNEMMKSVIDRFGIRVFTRPVGEDRFLATVKVCLSPTFFRWVFGWNGQIQIEGPPVVRRQYREMLEKECGLY